MLTTAGAARATESAKLCITTVVRGGPTGAAPRDGAVTAPSSAGFHQTTRKAAARPTTTALSKKLARVRAFCNPTPHASARMTTDLCIMRPQYSLGNTTATGVY